jgi:type VI secretion system secreted protein Hcp
VTLTMANAFYVSIEGEKQGKFKGEAAFSKFGAGKITGVAFFMETLSPRDLATGQASGKRQHKPIRFTKEWGAASPQLYQALVTNEVLKSVLFEFVRTDSKGAEEVHYTIKLTNASIARVASIFDLTSRTGSRFDGHELEQIDLTFESIELEDKVGKTTANDDWVVNN